MFSVFSMYTYMFSDGTKSSSKQSKRNHMLNKKKSRITRVNVEREKKMSHSVSVFFVCENARNWFLFFGSGLNGITNSKKTTVLFFFSNLVALPKIHAVVFFSFVLWFLFMWYDFQLFLTLFRVAQSLLFVNRVHIIKCKSCVVACYLLANHVFLWNKSAYIFVRRMLWNRKKKRSK